MSLWLPSHRFILWSAGDHFEADWDDSIFQVIKSVLPSDPLFRIDVKFDFYSSVQIILPPPLENLLLSNRIMKDNDGLSCIRKAQIIAEEGKNGE